MQKQISVPAIIGIVAALVLVLGFAAYRLAAPAARSVPRSTTAGMPGGSGSPPLSAFKPIDQVHPVPHTSGP